MPLASSRAAPARKVSASVCRGPWTRGRWPASCPFSLRTPHPRESSCRERPEAAPPLLPVQLLVSNLIMTNPDPTPEELWIVRAKRARLGASDHPFDERRAVMRMRLANKLKARDAYLAAYAASTAQQAEAHRFWQHQQLLYHRHALATAAREALAMRQRAADAQRAAEQRAIDADRKVAAAAARDARDALRDAAEAATAAELALARERIRQLSAQQELATPVPAPAPVVAPSIVVVLRAAADPVANSVGPPRRPEAPPAAAEACAICLEDLDDASPALACGHKFHAACMRQLAEAAWGDGNAPRTRGGTHVRCPLCQKQMRI